MWPAPPLLGASVGDAECPGHAGVKRLGSDERAARQVDAVPVREFEEEPRQGGPAPAAGRPRLVGATANRDAERAGLLGELVVRCARRPAKDQRERDPRSIAPLGGLERHERGLALATSAWPAHEGGRLERGEPLVMLRRPRGECASTSIPSSMHRATTPPRSATSENGPSAISTTAMRATATASSSWRRVTLDRPTRRTRPARSSSASARTLVAHGTRGSGACRR